MSYLDRYKHPADISASEPVRLARLMRLPKPAQMSELKLAEKVATGLPLKTVAAIAPLVNMFMPGAIYKVVSESTLRRAKSCKRLTREPSERVYEMSRVIDHAAKVYHGDEAAVGRFLNRPNSLLGGRTPFKVACASSAGAHAVVRLLQEADAGVAV